MRILRFLALLLVVITVFITTPTFEWQPLGTLLPDDLLADSALFTRFQRWMTQDLPPFALLLTGCAGLTFGLLTTPWSFRRIHPTLQITTTLRLPVRGRLRTGRRILGGFLLLLALISNVTMLVFYFRNGVETPLLHGLWIGSSFLLLIAAAVWTQRRPLYVGAKQTITSEGHSVDLAQSVTAQERIATEQVGETRTNDLGVTIGWGTLITMLVFAFLLYGWNLTTLPTTIHETTLRIGLHVLALNTSSEVSLFAPIAELSRPEHPFFSLLLTPTALFARLGNDLLFGTRTAGIVAALLCTLGMWLIGVELFARTADPVRADEYMGPIEDNGHSPAALATLLFIANMGMLYYSRLPVMLTATAWGMLGCWALLRGIRTGDRLALTLSGMLVGLGLLFHGGALVFFITGLLWWIGFAAVRLGLLPHHLTVHRSSNAIPPQLRTPDGVNMTAVTVGNFLLWGLGSLLVLSPFLPSLIQGGRSWFAHVAFPPVTSLMTIFTSFAPLAPTYPAPLYNQVLLPLIPLAIGALIFNLDRRQGWLISSWLCSALGVAAWLQTSPIRWDYLLPLIPAGVLAMTFALDRLRVTLVRVGGRWLQQFLTFFLLGLVLWTAFHNGITYYTFALEQSELVSAVGRALRSRAPEQRVVVLQQAAAPILAPDDPELLFLTNGTSNQPDGTISFVTQVPESLPPGTLFVVPAQENYWLPTVETAYPRGEYTVVRDHYANPLVYLYTLQD